MSDALKPQPQLILASRSPRRESLLREAGFDFIIDPADIDEDDYPPEAMPIDLAVRLARFKSHTVSARHPDAVVLGADTIVALGDRIVGKPRDHHHATEILRLLSGTTHVVVTGVSVIRKSAGFAEERRRLTAVQMRRLTPGEIEIYVASEEWRGKAGGYGIQDNDPFVTRLTGCYTNVVGLPTKLTATLLAMAGIFPRDHKHPVHQNK
jgi:septum formation protein